jgi:hypothetical protein
MKFKLFGLRIPALYVGIPVAAMITAGIGGITASIGGALGIGLLFALAFTALENGLFRQVLFGKIGNNPMAWFGVQAFGEIVSFVAVAWILGALFGVSISSWAGWVAYALTGIALVQDTFRTFLLNVAMWLHVRGSR